MSIAIVTSCFLVFNYTLQKSRGKRKQIAVGDEDEDQDTDDEPDRKRHCPDSTPDIQREEQPTFVDPDSDIPRSLDTLPRNLPYSLPYVPNHRSTFPAGPSRKRTRDSESHHAESSAAGAKRTRLSVPDDYNDDHSDWVHYQDMMEQKRKAKLAGKRAKIDRASLEDYWSMLDKRANLLEEYLRGYEQEVKETFDLDLARVREAFILPDHEKRHRWTDRAMAQAYPLPNHPAWGVVPRERVFAWVNSPLLFRQRPWIESLDRNPANRVTIPSALRMPVVSSHSAPLPTEDDEEEEEEEEEEESVVGRSGASHDDTHQVDAVTVVPSNPESADSCDDEDDEPEDDTPPPPAQAPVVPSRPLCRSGAFYGRVMYNALFKRQH